MYTANTMSSAIEAMGMSLPYSSTMAAEDAEKADSAANSGEVLVNAVHRELLPRQIMTRKAFENAIAVVMAVGGSTNAVLHLLAIAHAAEVPLKHRRLRDHPPAHPGACAISSPRDATSPPSFIARAAFRR